MSYRIIFKGAPGQILNVGGLSVATNDVQYVESLPAGIVKVLKGIVGVTVEQVTEQPKTVAEANKEKAVLTGTVGIMWDGTVQVRATEFGPCKKGEVRWDLPREAVEELAKRSGFVKVG